MLDLPGVLLLSNGANCFCAANNHNKSNTGSEAFACMALGFKPLQGDLPFHCLVYFLYTVLAHEHSGTLPYSSIPLAVWSVTQLGCHCGYWLAVSL